MFLPSRATKASCSVQVEGWFEQAVAQNWQGIEYSFQETVESGHHRLETRQIWAVPVSQLPPLHRQNLWPGLTTVVMVISMSSRARSISSSMFFSCCLVGFSGIFEEYFLRVV